MALFSGQIADLPERRLIDSQFSKYEEWDRYYSGDIFDERSEVPSDSPDTEPPLLYPLRINIAKMLCILHAQALLGQWEDAVVTIKMPGTDERAQRVNEVLDGIWEENERDQMFAEMALAIQRYGGAVIKVSADPALNCGIRYELINPSYFIPRWHPQDVKRIMECWVQYYITAADANLMYGIPIKDSPERMVLYSEHWTPREYEVRVDNLRIEEYSGPNPYGFVPFVYIPRFRGANEFYGVSVIDDIMGLQDELNLRLADMGDRINYVAHPVRWVRNYRGKKDLMIAPDKILDLGQSIGDQHDPEIGVLPAETEPASTLNYINFLWDLSRYSAMIPAVALGVDEGSQRSGLTLTLRMWPLVQSAKWTRVFIASGIRRLTDMTLRIRKFRDPLDGRKPAVTDDMIGAEVDVQFAPVLPRDRMDMVNELNLMWNTEYPAVSLETIVEKLGYTDDLEEEIARVLMTWEKKVGGKNTERANRAIPE